MAKVKIGTAKVDITPINNGWNPMWMGGYDFALRPDPQATGVTRNLYARALAIEDSTGAKVIVTADILGFPPSLARSIRSKIISQLGSQFGLTDKDLMLTASHTHSGPALPEKLDPYITYNLKPDQVSVINGYADWLGNAIVKLVKEALTELAASPRKFRMFYGVGSLGSKDFARNRRELGPPFQVDSDSGNPPSDVPVLVIQKQNGKVKAIVFTYACHAVIYGASETTYDSDFPGAAADLLEAEYPGATALFVNGAAGDINPDGDLLKPADPTLDAATRLKKAVVEVINNRLQLVEGPIKTQYQTLKLPLDLLPANELKTMYQEIAENTASFPELSVQGEQHRHAMTMINQISSGNLQKTVDFPIQVWRFESDDPVVLIALGGEPMVSYSVKFKNEFNTAGRIWVAGYANELPSYIPTQVVLDNPGYEAGWYTEYGEKAGDGSMLYYCCGSRFLGNAGDSGVEQQITSKVKNMVVTPQPRP